MTENKMTPEWELFYDDSYFGMWAVRDKCDRSFESPRLFHFIEKVDAEKFLELIKKANIALQKKE